MPAIDRAAQGVQTLQANMATGQPHLVGIGPPGKRAGRLVPPDVDHARVRMLPLIVMSIAHDDISDPYLIWSDGLKVADARATSHVLAQEAI